VLRRVSKRGALTASFRINNATEVFAVCFRVVVIKSFVAKGLNPEVLRNLHMYR
jgi:hypothetical protein